MPLLFESDVLEAAAQHLSSLGFRIDQTLETSQQGIDLIASRGEPNSLTVYLEGKGETSSLESSARFGEPFDSAQSKIHIAEAFYTAAELVLRSDLSNPRKVAIALPDNELHRRYESRIHDALSNLGIGVFWVSSDKRVLLDAPWDLA